MSRAPSLAGDGRARGLAALAGLGLAQAAAAAAAAIATRALFLRWHDGLDPAPALAGLAAAAGALAALRAAERILAEDFGQRYAAAVRRAVFAHLARLPLAGVEAQRTGGMMLRFTGDLSALAGWASRGAARLAVSGLALPLTLTALVWLSPAAALGAALPLALGAAGMGLAGAALGARHRDLRRRRARLAADMGERLRLAPLLRLMGRMGLELDRLDGAADGLRRAALARARHRGLLRAAPDLAGAVAAAGAALVCWRAGATAAELAGAFAALALAVGHMRALGGVWDRRHAAVAAQRRLEALLATPALPRSRHGRMIGRAPALRLQSVAAGPLHGFDAVLKPGEKVALIGEAGTGKTTLLRLAAGLAAPAAGRVRVFGADPIAMAARERSGRIHFLDAEPPVLTGSLRRALCFGLPRRPDDAALTALARRLGLDRALARLGGLDGAIGEGARALSHGERGLISLARLMLSPEALALLDAPDAHLDAEARALLRAEIARRPGAALVAARHPDVAAACTAHWALRRAGDGPQVARNPHGAAEGADRQSGFDRSPGISRINGYLPR